MLLLALVMLVLVAEADAATSRAAVYCGWMAAAALRLTLPPRPGYRRCSYAVFVWFFILFIIISSFVAAHLHFTAQFWSRRLQDFVHV